MFFTCYYQWRMQNATWNTRQYIVKRWHLNEAVYLNDVTIDNARSRQKPMTELLFCEYGWQAKLAEILSHQTNKTSASKHWTETIKYPTWMKKVKYKLMQSTVHISDYHTQKWFKQEFSTWTWFHWLSHWLSFSMCSGPVHPKLFHILSNTIPPHLSWASFLSSSIWPTSVYNIWFHQHHFCI